ncbi:MAG: VOC family protein [Nocardioides sp.]
MSPTWMSAFLDLAPESYDAGVAFWQGVTGYGLSPSRGEYDEFATLVAPDGDDFLRVQRLGSGPSRLHLDVHASGHEFAIHTSPGGLAWCTVSHPAAIRPRAAAWPGGHRSVVDQVCLDIPSGRYGAECAFWSDLLGWGFEAARHPEFRRLHVPTDQPLRMLLQRLDEPDGPVRAHLDLATDDRPAETERHVALGAEVVDSRPGWTVLRDPAGSAYCITDRDPDSGYGR